METFEPPRSILANSRFAEQKRAAVRDMVQADIDAPIVDLIRSFNHLPHCFTLQSCFGHFTWLPDQDTHNVEPLPAGDLDVPVRYRIAYLAFCLDDGTERCAMMSKLRDVTCIDPEYVQFGCADWFWTRQINSYVLQVEPLRFEHRDEAILGFPEARRIEQVRNRFFEVLRSIVD
jgi:hypothetical protein